MTQTTYYHATLCLHGTLLVTKDEEHGSVKVALGMGDKQIPISVKRKLAMLLQDKPPEGVQSIILWPRTTRRGY